MQGQGLQPEESEPVQEGAADDVIRDLIVGEAVEQQPSSPLAERDWNQSRSENAVKEAEATVQTSPPERSRSRDSGRSRSRERAAPAEPIPVQGPGRP